MDEQSGYIRQKEKKSLTDFQGIDFYSLIGER